MPRTREVDKEFEVDGFWDDYIVEWWSSVDADYLVSSQCQTSVCSVHVSSYGCMNYLYRSMDQWTVQLCVEV
jgi:hypothetical protein